MYLIAIDVETTGFSPIKDKIVEIALVRFDFNTIYDDHYTAIFNPGFPMDEKVISIHGITNEMAEVESVDLDNERETIQAYLADCDAIVGHNISFDWRFMQAEKLCPNKSCLLICTQTLSNGGRRFEKGHKLDQVAARYGIEPMPGAHRAMRDAIMCARIAQEMEKKYSWVSKTIDTNTQKVK